MGRHSLPDDFIALVVKRFRRGSRKNDPSAITAQNIFLSKAELNPKALAQAQIDIENDAKISAFIEEIRGEIADHKEEVRKEFEAEVKGLLKRIDNGTQSSLTTQTAMRAEFTAMLGDMRSESRALLDELHGSVKEVKVATEANARTSADIRAAADTLKQQNEGLAKDNGVLKENTHPGKNFRASLLTNALVGAVFYGLGLITPSSTSNITDQKKDQPSGGSEKSAPVFPSQTGASPFSLLPPYGLDEPYSGKNMLDLLNDGQTVRLFKQDGSSICLQMPKPIPCIGADIPKPQPPNPAIDAPKPDKPVTPPQPHRHIRRHHGHHSCAR